MQGRRQLQTTSGWRPGYAVLVELHAAYKELEGPPENWPPLISGAKDDSAEEGDHTGRKARSSEGVKEKQINLAAASLSFAVAAS